MSTPMSPSNEQPNQQQPYTPPAQNMQPGQQGPYQGPGQPPYVQHPGAVAFAQPPAPKKRRVWLWVLIAVLALFLILLVSCAAFVGTAVKNASPGATSTTLEGGTASDAPSGSASKAPSSKGTAQIGDTVKAGDWEFKVSDFDCGHKSVGANGFGEKAQGQFCFLKVTAKNNGDSEGTLSDSSQKLTDTDGKTFSSDSAAALFEDPDDAVFFKGVNPGNTVKGLIVFDVPKDAKITEVSLTGGLFDGSAEVSLR